MADFWQNLRANMADAFGNYDIYLRGQGDSDEMKQVKDDMKDTSPGNSYWWPILKNQYQRALVNQWTNYKNDSINRVSGKSVGDWAREGKMFDDYGNLLDIDYGYYATVPYSTLERVFRDGAEDVWNVISNKYGITKKKKEEKGE